MALLCLGLTVVYFKYFYKANLNINTSKKLKAFASSLTSKINLYNMDNLEVSNSVNRGSNMTLYGDTYSIKDDAGNTHIYRKVEID